MPPNGATIEKYADDSTIHTKAKTIDELESKLNSALVNVSKWCNQNKMALNTDKTFSIDITTYPKAWRLPRQSLYLILNGSLLQPLTSQNYLV